MDITNCPDCGSELTIDPACVIQDPPVAYSASYPPLRDEPLVYRRPASRVAPAALCNGCEFCIEITADIGFKIVP